MKTFWPIRIREFSIAVRIDVGFVGRINREISHVLLVGFLSPVNHSDARQLLACVMRVYVEEGG